MSDTIFQSIDEAVSTLKLDRRRKYIQLNEGLFYSQKYSHPCSGCTETPEMTNSPERGSGCHECGYNGRVRDAVPIPVFMSDGSSVKITTNPPPPQEGNTN